MTYIWTDGACSGNPGPGGWGAIIKTPVQEVELAGFEGETTNNRMELTAAIEALKRIPGSRHITLYSDSEYVTKGFTDGRLEKWKKNGWKSGKNAVKNQDLWMLLDTEVQRHSVTFIHVDGHSDNELNNRCDKLATEQIKKYRES